MAVDDPSWIAYQMWRRSNERLTKRRRDDEIDEFAALITIWSICSYVPRNSSCFRKQWDSEYLLDLAEKEDSFIAEYRISPHLFEISSAKIMLHIRGNVSLFS